MHEEGDNYKVKFFGKGKSDVASFGGVKKLSHLQLLVYIIDYRYQELITIKDHRQFWSTKLYKL